MPTIEAPDNRPPGDLFNIKISDLFSDDDRQAALQLQQQLTHQLGHTVSEREQLVYVIEKQRQQRKRKEAQKTCTITKEHLRIPTSQYHEMELGEVLASQTYSIETFKKPSQHIDHSKPREQ